MNRISDLVGLRQWLVQIADRVPTQAGCHKAHKMITEVDDYIWTIIFKEESPWATKIKNNESVSVFDPDFEETVCKIKEGKLNVSRQSKFDGYKNS